VGSEILWLGRLAYKPNVVLWKGLSTPSEGVKEGKPAVAFEQVVGLVEFPAAGVGQSPVKVLQ
jgi:hypothetical protein